MCVPVCSSPDLARGRGRGRCGGGWLQPQAWQLDPGWGRSLRLGSSHLVPRPGLGGPQECPASPPLAVHPAPTLLLHAPAPTPQMDSEGLTLAAAGQAPEVLNCWLWRVLSTPEAPVRTEGGLHCLACAGHPGAFVLLRPERRWVGKGEGVRGGLGEMGESLERARGLTPLRRERTED